MNEKMEEKNVFFDFPINILCAVGGHWWVPVGLGRSGDGKNKTPLMKSFDPTKRFICLPACIN